MPTIKRNIPSLGQNYPNTSKYFNQMTFKGIVFNTNPFDVDQLSLKDAKNVYVDENGTLISRPPITTKKLPVVYTETDGITEVASILLPGYILVDIFETGRIRVYISKSGNDYNIVAMDKTGNTIKRLPNVQAYHITAYEKYIIVFNNIDAQVLDINDFGSGWKLLRDMAEIPITKRVVEQETFTYPKNQFTESYKEEYLFSDKILSILPSGTAKVVTLQSANTLNWTLPNANINTEFRIVRTLNVEVTPSDLVTVATNETTGVSVIAIAKSDHVLLSFDDGESFDRIVYPINLGFLQVASLSLDALHFFFVAVDGVYRYSITEKEWVVIRLTTVSDDTSNLAGVGINNACSFNNAEVFSFALSHTTDSIPTTDIYWKGPNLKTADYAENTLGYTRITNAIYPETQITKAGRDSAKMSLVVRTEGEEQTLVASVIAWLPGQTTATTTFVNILGKNGAVLHEYHRSIDKAYGVIDTVKIITDLTDFHGVEITGATIQNGAWHTIKMIVGIDNTQVPTLTIDYTGLITDDATDQGAPINLVNGYITDFVTSSVDGEAPLPDELSVLDRYYTVGDGRYFYALIDGKIYTNKMLTTNTTTLTYSKISNMPFTQIPQVSYADTNIYLAFNNILKVTENIQDGEHTKFNLPVINNHSFASDINALINISTTEIAIFLINQVFVVTKVPDEVFGYRYDYRTTRLSTGVRLGDEVLNTINGAFTLYPTSQGLALMNYQPDVANTDQIVDYVTKNIVPIWKTFYSAGRIKLVQMRDYIYLSNGTKSYLMLDLRGMSWWYFESPLNIIKISTDQFELDILSNGLYTYNFDTPNYKDLSTRFIDWKLESQPNHFNVPNHYKNLRQLIFQLEEATNTQQTIKSQMKLYRKQLTIREPDIIGFTIESYRTFIKRFSYWKINELQWALAADEDTAFPAQLKLNGLTIKYEISEEVRS